MALRRSAALRAAFFTAQDVARFCEVDLKTVHLWADRQKIPHQRTTGRHLRFRRNDIVRFLSAHGYPLPEELTSVRPLAVIAAPEAPDWPLTPEELARKLATRFDVQLYTSAVAGIARLAADTPDVMVMSADDPTVDVAAAIPILRQDPSGTSTFIVVVGAFSPANRADEPASRPPDLVIAAERLPRLAKDLAKELAIAARVVR